MRCLKYSGACDINNMRRRTKTTMAAAKRTSLGRWISVNTKIILSLLNENERKLWFVVNYVKETRCSRIFFNQFHS